MQFIIAISNKKESKSMPKIDAFYHRHDTYIYFDLIITTNKIHIFFLS